MAESQHTQQAWSPQWQQTPPLRTDYAGSPNKYANEVRVIRTEHDATLRFYRKTAKPDGSGSAGKFIAEITVPLGVLDGLTTKEQ